MDSALQAEVFNQLFDPGFPVQHSYASVACCSQALKHAITATLDMTELPYSKVASGSSSFISSALTDSSSHLWSSKWICQ